MEKLNVKGNLRKAVEAMGITKKKFYEKTGISNGYLDNEFAVREDYMNAILNAFPNISMPFLLTGEGEPLLYVEAMPEKAELKVDAQNLKNFLVSEFAQRGITTQRDMAFFLGYSETYLSSMLKGSGEITEKFVKTICEKLDLDMGVCIKNGFKPSVQQNIVNGNNLIGNNVTGNINSSIDSGSLLEIINQKDEQIAEKDRQLAKRDEQIDRLISIIEKSTK